MKIDGEYVFFGDTAASGVPVIEDNRTPEEIAAERAEWEREHPKPTPPRITPLPIIGPVYVLTDSYYEEHEVIGVYRRKADAELVAEYLRALAEHKRSSYPYLTVSGPITIGKIPS